MKVLHSKYEELKVEKNKFAELKVEKRREIVALEILIKSLI